MATKISWCDETWNVVTGCTPAGQGCQNCYARRMFGRLASMPNQKKYCGRTFDQVACHEDALIEPHQWSSPRSIFVPSMGDLFHPDVPPSFIARVIDKIEHDFARHTCIVLTKRIERAHDLAVNLFCEPYPSNMVLGVSCSTQAEIDAWVPVLLGAPAAKRVVSLEPLVEHVTLNKFCFEMTGEGTAKATTGNWLNALNGVIVGGESGPGARRMRANWVRILRDQCRAAGTRFCFKQWGDGCGPDAFDDLHGVCATMQAPHHGRLLDGCLHNDLPWEVRA